MRNAAWVWVAVVAMTVGGCQCLEPVGEVGQDGGQDGGSQDGGSQDSGSQDSGRSDAGFVDAGPADAGFDGGPQPQCTTAAQCTGALPSQSLCNFASDGGYSCIQQRCVFECTKGRACDFDAGTACLECSAPPQTTCRTVNCGAATLQGQVESTSSACTVGFVDVMLTPAGCQYTVSDVSGAKGVMTNLGNGQYVGQFNGLGTCVGVSLMGQVERVLFSCEGCQFTLRI